MLYYLELMGLSAFAISGVLASKDQRPDIVGGLILAFTTALGGGIIRDAILGSSANSFSDPINFYVILVSAIVAMLIPDRLEKHNKKINIADAIGLGLFSSSGLVMALNNPNISFVFSIILAAITGCGGGIVRELLCNKMPALLKRGEIYISACIAGSLVGLILNYFSFSMNSIAMSSAGVTIIIRLLAIQFKWKLPSYARQVISQQ